VVRGQAKDMKNLYQAESAAMERAPLYAHTMNERGESHGLEEHLLRVAELAKEFCQKFGAGSIGWALGLAHDLGKANPAFQQYLTACEAGQPSDSVPHSAPGAAATLDQLRAFAIAVLGHHGGLANPERAKADIEEANSAAVEHACSLASQLGLQRLTDESFSSGSDALSFEMLLRMCFSALIDADRLDTEAHFNYDCSALRSNYPTLANYTEKLNAHLNQLSIKASAESSAVNRVRAEILKHCLERANDDHGAFRLAAPTGGGKTLSSLAFALNHAKKHTMDRVVVAIPYTSIIDQTAEVFGNIFGPENLLEHHSAFESETENEFQDPIEQRRRMAAENWDCPLIVTTNVQLFESLFSNRASRCRKLHNVAKSVIVLDEVQTLPVGLLLPILSGLEQLISRYGCSVVFCTATQPDYSGVCDSMLSKARDIVPNAKQLFDALNRVSYETIDQALAMNQLAQQIDRERQVLCVLNSRPDAVRLARACRQSEDLFHLSTLLCSDHRKRKLQEIRNRLNRSMPVRLISTQVVEAGVDLDFPVVMRELGPLDRIIQAAGRCNREGKLRKQGRCIVFSLAEARSPQGDYKTATSVTESIVRENPADFAGLDSVARFFREYFNYAGAVIGAGKEIQDCRLRLRYQDVAKKFKLIPDDCIPMVVMGYDRDRAEKMLAQSSLRPQALFRQFMPLSVSVLKREFEMFRELGIVTQHQTGLWLYEGEYDDLLGIGKGNERDPSDLII
jgi:CRISPR-associated endonuclease/helicase Cas3